MSATPNQRPAQDRRQSSIPVSDSLHLSVLESVPENIKSNSASEQTLSALAQAMNSRSVDVRKQLVRAFRYIDEPSIAVLMQQALEDEDDEVRLSAVGSIAESSIDEWSKVSLLASALQDPEMTVREQAILGLAGSEDPGALQYLLKSAEADTDPGNRTIASLLAAARSSLNAAESAEN